MSPGQAETRCTAIDSAEWVLSGSLFRQAWKLCKKLRNDRKGGFEWHIEGNEASHSHMKHYTAGYTWDTVPYINSRHKPRCYSEKSNHCHSSIEQDFGRRREREERAEGREGKEKEMARLIGKRSKPSLRNSMENFVLQYMPKSGYRSIHTPHAHTTEKKTEHFTDSSKREGNDCLQERENLHTWNTTATPYSDTYFL